MAFLAVEHALNICRTPVFGFELLTVFTPGAGGFLHVRPVNLGKNLVWFDAEGDQRAVGDV